ncbi:MAG: aminotransferase class V-fold PLP-dependent enzyme [Planctomycetota bacterium]
MNRIYLDNASTSWPKPESVYRAVDQVSRNIGAAAGRGLSKDNVQSQRIVEQTRQLVADKINAPSVQNVSFAFNGTDALSTAIFGFVKPGDHVITTASEHNSVLRPLYHLQSSGTIELSIVGTQESGKIEASEIVDAIQPNTRLVTIIHASNVTGVVQPVHKIISDIRDAGWEKICVLVDAAQSLGHLEVDVQKLGCDFLAAPGHKGLLGPLGTGFLYSSDRVIDLVQPLRFGGTGTDKSVEFQPTTAPGKFESGNLNVPGLAGLKSGMEFLQSDEGIERLNKTDQSFQMLVEGLMEIPAVKMQGPATTEDRIPVLSMSIDGFDANEAAVILETTWGIQCRAGIHCAPLLHRALGTEKEGGTIRLSLGLFNTEQEVVDTLNAIGELGSSLK